jgi:hypothetical protein
LGEIPVLSPKFSKDQTGVGRWRGKTLMIIRDSTEVVDLVEDVGGDGEMKHNMLIPSSRGDGMIGGLISRMEGIPTNNGERGSQVVISIRIPKESNSNLT